MIRVEGPLTTWLDGEVRVVREVCFESEEDVELGARGALLTHSFVNAHTHLPMILLRGLVTEKNFWDWLSEVRRLEEEMRRSEIRAGYLLGIYENVLSGNTVIYSMYRGYELIEETLGAEVHVGPISTRESDRDVLSLLERFVRRKPDGVVPTLYAHSLYMLPLERLKELAELRDYELQLHVSETKEEVKVVRERFGQYPVRVMRALGLLRENTMLVHAGWITKGELDLVAEAGASLVHVPASNARLAIHGFFPWKEATERNIRVLFGTDSPASNDGQSILHDLRLALLSAKDRYWDAEPFGRRLVEGAFDRRGYALWVPAYKLPEAGESLVSTFLYAPHLFKLRLLIRDGRVLFPIPERGKVRRALRIAERFREKVGQI